MSLDLSAGAIFAAGALSFLSPCVLPLVPPYLCFITGASLDDLADGKNGARRAFPAALAFVAGFSTVFMALGASASWIGQILQDWRGPLTILAGLFIILMGLHFLGLLRIGFLNREARYQVRTRPVGLLGAYGVGLAFAFGWIPCIGPVLGAILTLAASTQSMAQGVQMLGLYSLGLGLPFLISALGISTFLAFLRRFRSQLGRVEKVMGALLVLTGILFLTGGMQSLSYWLQEYLPALTRLG